MKSSTFSEAGQKELYEIQGGGLVENIVTAVAVGVTIAILPATLPPAIVGAASTFVGAQALDAANNAPHADYGDPDVVNEMVKNGYWAR